MSVIDSLINGIRFNDVDEDPDIMDDEIDEEEYEEERPAKKRGVFNRRPASDEYDEVVPARNPRAAQPSAAQGGLVPSRRKAAGVNGMQVRIIKPSSFEQSKQIADTLLSHRTVLLNLEGLDVATAQRIVDFASGSCYALHGNFMKISHYIIVITPEDVSISGDISMEGEAMAGLGAIGGLAGLGAAAAAGNGDLFSSNPFTQNMTYQG